MLKSSFSCAAVAVAVVAQLALVAMPAAAAEPAAPIAQLPAQHVNTDVRSACPGIDAALQASLARAVRLAPADGLVGVKFKVEGDHVVRVRVDGNHFDELGRTVRWAVGALPCQAAGTQEFAFTLHFNNVDGAPAEQQVALLP